MQNAASNRPEVKPKLDSEINKTVLNFFRTTLQANNTPLQWFTRNIQKQLFYHVYSNPLYITTVL